jgi:AcrR family transcriptional regulator
VNLVPDKKVRETAARTPKRRRKGDCTREALLRAAVAIWSEEGIGRVTMNGVARRAGKTRGTVYHHFSDREALVQGAKEQLDTLLESMFSGSNRALGDPFDLVLGLVADSPEQMRSYIRGMLDEGARGNRLVGRAIQYFQALNAQGRIRPGVDPIQAALSVFGLWLAALLSASLADTPKARRLQTLRFRRTFKHLVFRALIFPESAEYSDDEA